jgi:hypothetical protein
MLGELYQIYALLHVLGIEKRKLKLLCCKLSFEQTLNAT